MLFKKMWNEIAFRERARQLHKRSLAHYVEKTASIPRVACEERVVFTFTTIPERIAAIDVMLKSLLDQSVLPDKIYLCIPRQSRLAPFRYEIPEWMHTIPLLEILEVETDLGPITKVIPALVREAAYPNARIVIVDDDGLYPHALLETLIQWSQRLPDAALGCSGVSVPSGLLPSDILLKPHSWAANLRLTPKTSQALSKVDYLFGYAGIVVQPRFFTPSIHDYSGSPAGAYFEDDLWVGGNLQRNGVERYVIPSPVSRMMPGACKQTLNTRALCLTDNKDGRNMDEVFNFLFR